MLSGASEIRIDEDELLEELDALQEEEAIKLDFAIPSAPKANLEAYKSTEEPKEAENQEYLDDKQAELA